MINRMNQLLRLTSIHRRKVWYVPILVVAMALMMGRLLVMARLLSIEEFGYFSIGILVSSTFSMSGCFGLQIMLQRDAPGQFMRKEDHRVVTLTIQSCMVSVALFVICLFVVGVTAELLAIAGPLIALGLLHGLSQQLFLIATVESRSRGDVLRYALQNLLRSAAIFCASFAISYKFESAANVLVAEAAITIVFSYRIIKAGIRDQTAISTLVRTAYLKLAGINWTVALLLLSSSAYGILLSNGDRWVASSFLDITKFAQYSFAWIILAVAQSAQSVINASVFPFVSVRYATRGTRAAYTACAVIAGGICLMLSLLCLPAYFLIKFAVEMWYPAYGDIIPIIPIFLCIAILRVSDFWRTFMLVCGLEKTLVYTNSFSLILVFLVVVVAYTSGFLVQIDGLKVACLALVANLTFVGTTATVSFANRASSIGPRQME